MKNLFEHEADRQSAKTTPRNQVVFMQWNKRVIVIIAYLP